MLTLFTIPKPFHGHIRIIQTNAIRSWLQLRPSCEIILFGDEEGMAEIATEYGVKHVPDVECNEYGTPLISGVFQAAQELASHPLMCYVNADIILMSDLMTAVQGVRSRRFLMVGQRWNVELKELWNFDQADWEERLCRYVAHRAALHPPVGSDYFVFPRGMVGALPPFAVGRPGWDNWLIYRARALGVRVIDATQVATVIHQNHDYGHVPRARERESWEGPEADYNRDLAGGWEHVFTLLDANWAITPNGLRPALTKKHLRRRWEVLPILHPRLHAPIQLLKRGRRAPHRVLSAIICRMNRLLGSRA
jgi:hypothetical protein